MKAPREIKRYIQRYKKQLKAMHYDDLYLIIKMWTCKKWYKRDKRIKKDEWE